MKLLVLTLCSLSLLTSASAQTIDIARSGTRPPSQGPAENFTGSVRVDPYFQATDATRAGGALVTFDAAPAASAQPAQPTAAQRIVGNFAPKLGELTDEVLFGDVWARPQLSPRDRSPVTVSALIAMNRPQQLRSHLLRARENGVTEAELAEAMTHLAFYSGWPNALTAVTVAREVFEPKQ